MEATKKELDNQPITLRHMKNFIADLAERRKRDSEDICKMFEQFVARFGEQQTQIVQLFERIEALEQAKAASE